MEACRPSHNSEDDRCSGPCGRRLDQLGSPAWGLLGVMLQEDLRQVMGIELDSFGHPWSGQDSVEHADSLQE